MPGGNRRSHRVGRCVAFDPSAPTEKRHDSRRAARDRRLGTGHRCGALLVATRMTGAQGVLPRGVADFTTCVLAVCASSAGPGVKVLQLILAHGSTPAPRPGAAAMAALQLAFAVRREGWPTEASWFDQVDILLRYVPREVLTPHDFPSPTAFSRDRMDSFAARPQHPKPGKWP